MSIFKVPLAVAVLVLALSCCCCLGTLFGEPEFTTGNFSDVPSYPDALQTTDSNALYDSLLAPFEVFGEVEWKHYTTIDSEHEVLVWYEETLPEYGWSLHESTQTNGLTFMKVDDDLVMLAVLATDSLDLDSNDTHILVGRITPFGED